MFPTLTEGDGHYDIICVKLHHGNVIIHHWQASAHLPSTYNTSKDRSTQNEISLSHTRRKVRNAQGGIGEFPTTGPEFCLMNPG